MKLFKKRPNHFCSNHFYLKGWADRAAKEESCLDEVEEKLEALLQEVRKLRIHG